MSDEEVIERYMRRFDRAVGAEPAALNELLESFSDDAVVNFDGTPHAGRARLLDLFGQVLGPLVEAHTHFTPERLPDGTVKVPWAASGRMSDGTVIAIAGTEYYTINDQGLITNLVNEPCGLPLTPGADEPPVASGPLHAPSTAPTILQVSRRWSHASLVFARARARNRTGADEHDQEFA